MLPQNKSYKDFKFIRKPYKCAHATFNKYGKDIEIHDFVQNGKDGTIAKELVQKAGGIQELAKQAKELPNADICIDLNMDCYTANKILKAGKLAEEKIKKQAELQKKLEEINKKTEPKEGNVNE